MQILYPDFGNVASPDDFSRGAIKADDLQLLLAFVGCNKDPIAGQDRRGVSGRQRSFPKDILIGTELDWKIRRSRDPGRIRSAKLRPLIIRWRGVIKKVWREHHQRHDH